MTDSKDPGVPGPSSSGQFVILVVDDEEMIRFLITRRLQGHGYVVLSAPDGKRALELSRKFPGSIDLVIADAIMPRLNGVEILWSYAPRKTGD